jgi:hypothetical protein
MAFALALLESSGVLLRRPLKFLAYVAPVDNEEVLHNRIVDACQAIRSYLGIFEGTRRSMTRRFQACIDSNAGHYEHLL